MVSSPTIYGEKPHVCVCVRLCTFYIQYVNIKKLLVIGFGFIMWLSHHHLLLVVVSILQRYKTYFSTSIGWYINIISVILI